MFSPLAVLGIALLSLSMMLFITQAFRILPRTRVKGTVVRLEEASSVGLADSLHRAVIQYSYRTGDRQQISTRARAFIGYALGDIVPVYLSTDETKPVIVGGLRELWLWPILLLGTGILCFAIATA